MNPNLVSPEIDYLSKDYSSFRRLLLNQLALRIPSWQERNPSDIGMTVVELLAYAADQLSYYQDAVATEAYLETARRPASIRKHARLLDYILHNGCNARVWVHFEVSGDRSEHVVHLPAGLQLVTRFRETSGPLMIERASATYSQALESGTVFETLHEAQLRSSCNKIHFAKQVGGQRSLRAGATSALLHVPHDCSLELHPGDVLILMEVRNPNTGIKSQADPKKRHAVRLTQVRPYRDGSADNSLGLEVRWSAADALPFELATSVLDEVTGHHPASVALGNVVLADHGRTRPDRGRSLATDFLPPVVPEQRYRPYLPYHDLTYSVPYRHEARLHQSASQTLLQNPNDALAVVDLWQCLRNARYRWQVRQDLLNSNDQSRDFVVETLANQRASLRFGLSGTGMTPSSADRFEFSCRTGKGTSGNVGAEAIAHWVEDDLGRVHPTKIRNVINPLPARGGVDPESLERVRALAPRAFRRQIRCVTAEDYANWVSQHSAVAEARAELEWTGHGRMAVIYVRRMGDLCIDSHFCQELMELLEPVRQIGHEVLIRSPRYVRARVDIHVRVAAQYHQAEVREKIKVALGRGILSDTSQGTKAFFDSQQTGFGQPIYRSQLIAHLMSLPGVEQVTLKHFGRLGGPPNSERIEVGPHEVVRPLEDDMTLYVEGGK